MSAAVEMPAVCKRLSTILPDVAGHTMGKHP